jgi:hypothetical protein
MSSDCDIEMIVMLAFCHNMLLFRIRYQHLTYFLLSCFLSAIRPSVLPLPLLYLSIQSLARATSRLSSSHHLMFLPSFLPLTASCFSLPFFLSPPHVSPFLSSSHYLMFLPSFLPLTTSCFSLPFFLSAPHVSPFLSSSHRLMFLPSFLPLPNSSL